MRFGEEVGGHLSQILSVLKRCAIGKDIFRKASRDIRHGRTRRNARDRIGPKRLQNRFVEPDDRAKGSPLGGDASLRDRRTFQLNADTPTAERGGGTVWGSVFKPEDTVRVRADGNKSVVYWGRQCVRKDDVDCHELKSSRKVVEIPPVAQMRNSPELQQGSLLTN